MYIVMVGDHVDRLLFSSTKVLTLCLLVPSADKLCKQFGPRSGPTNRRPDLDPNSLTL